MSNNPFNALQEFTTESGAGGNFFSLPQLEKDGTAMDRAV